MIFLLIHFLVTKAFKVQSLRRAYFGNNITGEKLTATFLLIVLGSLFVYWIYVDIIPIYMLVEFVRKVFINRQWLVGTYSEYEGISFASIKTMRGYIIFYGFYFFHIIFGLILLYELLPRVKKLRLETYSFTLLLFLSGMIGLFSLYLVKSGVYPDRFLMYGWLFGFPPLIVAILKVKYKWPKRLSIFLLVAFIYYNIYVIEPATWDARAEMEPIATSDENYALANTFNFSSGKIYGHQNSLMAIYDVHNNFGTVFSLSEVTLTKFDWIIIQKIGLELEKRYYQEPRTETIAALRHLATGYSTDYNIIYESNGLLVFELRQ